MYPLTVCSRQTASTKLPFPAIARAIKKFRDNNGVTSVYIQKGLCNRESKTVKLLCFGLPQQKLSRINKLHRRKLLSMLKTGEHWF
jgi:hypothetical protein